MLWLTLLCLQHIAFNLSCCINTRGTLKTSTMKKLAYPSEHRNYAPKIARHSSSLARVVAVFVTRMIGHASKNEVPEHGSTHLQSSHCP